MYNGKKRDELIKEFTANADINLELVASYGDMAESMKKDDPEMVKYLIDKAVKAVAASVPREIEVPDVSVYVTQKGDGCVSVIDLTLRNKYSSELKFKFKKQIVYRDNVFEILCDYLKVSWVELITDALIRKNLEVVNAKLAEIGKEAGNDFVVKVVPPMGLEGKKLASITDNEVVFVADDFRIFAMDDILLFYTPDESVSEEKVKEAYDDTVALFAKAQTTPQFLSIHEPLIGHICDISKMVKPITLIKKVHSKNVMNLRGNKDTYAYFNNGEVFSILSVTAEGKDVVLKPFDIETLEVKDFDVVAAI